MFKTMDEFIEYIKSFGIFEIEKDREFFDKPRYSLYIKPLDFSLRKYDKSDLTGYHTKFCEAIICETYDELPVPKVECSKRTIFDDDTKEFVEKDCVTIEIDYSTRILTEENKIDYENICKSVYKQYKLEIKKLYMNRKLNKMNKDFE